MKIESLLKVVSKNILTIALKFGSLWFNCYWLVSLKIITRQFNIPSCPARNIACPNSMAPPAVNHILILTTPCHFPTTRKRLKQINTMQVLYTADLNEVCIIHLSSIQHYRLMIIKITTILCSTSLFWYDFPLDVVGPKYWLLQFNLTHAVEGHTEGLHGLLTACSIKDHL